MRSRGLEVGGGGSGWAREAKQNEWRRASQAGGIRAPTAAEVTAERGASSLQGSNSIFRFSFIQSVKFKTIVANQWTRSGRKRTNR